MGEVNEKPKFGLRERKDKGREKFSSERMFEMIEDANVVYDPSTVRLSGEGEVSGRVGDEQSEKLEKALRRLGSECIDYRNHVKGARKAIQGAVFAGAAVLGPAAPAIFANDPNRLFQNLFISSLPAMFGLLRVTKGQEQFSSKYSTRSGDLLGIKQAKELRDDIEKSLLSLRLPKDYVNGNFDDITRALADREREAREDDELVESRKRLGLTEDQISRSVDSLSRQSSSK